MFQDLWCSESDSAFLCFLLTRLVRTRFLFIWFGKVNTYLYNIQIKQLRLGVKNCTCPKQNPFFICDYINSIFRKWTVLPGFNRDSKNTHKKIGIFDVDNYIQVDSQPSHSVYLSFKLTITIIFLQGFPVVYSIRLPISGPLIISSFFVTQITWRKRIIHYRQKVISLLFPGIGTSVFLDPIFRDDVLIYSYRNFCKQKRNILLSSVF